jgi:hypothetical protein
MRLTPWIPLLAVTLLGACPVSAATREAELSTVTFLLGALSGAAGVYLVLSSEQKKTPRALWMPTVLPWGVALNFRRSYE